MKDIPEPVKVSPIIKFFRYTFLAAGIIYGAAKLKALQVIEDGKKEERARKKLEREEKIAAERKAASDRDIAQIVAIFKGTTETDSDLSADDTFSSKPKIEPGEMQQSVKGDESRKLDAGEVKLEVKDDGNRKLDLGELNHKIKEDTCNDITMNPMSEMKHSDDVNIVPRVTNTTKIDQCTADFPLVQKPKEQGDIFSSVFNLSTTIPKTESKEEPGDNKTVAIEDLKKQLEQNEYIVESFKDKVPFAEADSFNQFRTEEK